MLRYDTRIEFVVIYEHDHQIGRSEYLGIERDKRESEAFGVHIRSWQEAVRAYLESDISPTAGRGEQ